MILSIVIILLVGLVVYFHYLQGFFSSGISAVLAVIASMVAIGYHEDVVQTLLGGKYAAQAHGIAIISLFAITYLLCRLFFDKAVSGNVRFPLLVDKIGSVVMGLVAGVFSVGTIVIAAHSLPFGPSIAGYSRFPINFGVATAVNQKGRGVDAEFDQLEAERFLNNQPDKLLVPVDDIVVSFAEHVTNPGGPLSSGKPLTSVHPDYLQELFGQRIGMQAAASRVAQLEKSMKILGVYLATSLSQDDQERWVIGNSPAGVRGPEAVPTPPPLPPTLKPQAGEALLVVRAELDVGAADKKNNFVSFGTGNVRLVANGKNYFPIGTLEGGRLLLRSAPDDYLFGQPGKAVDFVFQVNESDVLVPGENKTYQTKPDVFFEFKRLAKEDLPETVAVGVPPAGEKVRMMRKEGGRAPGSGGGATADAGRVQTSLVFEGTPNTNAALPVSVGVGVGGDNAKGEEDWGSFVVNTQRFERLEVNPTRTVEILRAKNPSYDALHAPRTHVVVQWTARPAGTSSWEWADDITNYELMDLNGKRFKPNGVAAKLVNANGGQMLLARYDHQRPMTSVPASNDMKVTDVTVYWVVPAGTVVNSLQFKGELVQSMNLTAQ